MIKPTVGRVVLFTPRHEHHQDHRQPWAALIAYVHGDRMVNLAAFDQNGCAQPKNSVQLLQDDDRKPEGGYFCSWMPYQVGQAVRAEELKIELDASNGVKSSS